VPAAEAHLAFVRLIALGVVLDVDLHAREDATAGAREEVRILRVVPYERRTSGWSRKASEAELKGVEGGD
jgi:hypothetical protein